MRRIKLLLLLCTIALAACGWRDQPYEITFTARFGASPIDCEANAGVVLSDLRFFVSEIVFTGDDGIRRPFSLSADQRWQGTDVALLDLENGRGSCENGTPEENRSLRGTLPPGTYNGISFRVGVPEALNHANPLLAAAPLNRTAMHWHWRSGYQFMRAGVRSGQDGFWLHLGSARCRGTIGNILGCAAGNRAAIELRGFDPRTDSISIDLAALVAELSLQDGVPGNCSSGPAETLCAAPFAALGLNFSSGQMDRPGRVFGVEKGR